MQSLKRNVLEAVPVCLEAQVLALTPVVHVHAVCLRGPFDEAVIHIRNGHLYRTVPETEKVPFKIGNGAVKV